MPEHSIRITHMKGIYQKKFVAGHRLTQMSFPPKACFFFTIYALKKMMKMPLNSNLLPTKHDPLINILLYQSYTQHTCT